MILNTIIAREPVDKGWSGDRKFRIFDAAGNSWLMRISPMARYDRVKAQFHRMEQVAALGIPMCLPIEFGTCAEGVYFIQSWITGQDAEAVIPGLSPAEQYAYGLDAGRILQKIHSIPAPADMGPWAERFNKKIDRKLQMYESSPLKYEKDAPFLEHIARSRHLLDNRTQTYQHGDYHIGNMMVDDRGRLTIIDFEKDDWGDPWEEFNRIVWCAQKAPYFASGMVDGYFDSQVPLAFWQLLGLYICSNTLGSLPWAISFGETEIQVMRNQAKEVLQWYDDMRCVIPSWYRKP